MARGIIGIRKHKLGLTGAVTPRFGVEDHKFTSPDEFLHALSPWRDVWRPTPLDWVYRGQRDANWGLVPKSQRAGEMNAFHIRQPDTLIDQFLRDLNLAGLPVPKNTIHDFTGIDYAGFALAQHYGMPTPLLDWTRRAWVAAYFAASTAVEAVSCGTKQTCWWLAVWCLHKARLPIHAVFAAAPAATNPNLHAQSGLFVTTHFGEHDRDIEEFAVRTCWDRSVNPEPVLRRFLLPTARAPELLRLLAYDGITAASMYPGPAGVVKAMREQALWDVPPVR